MNVEGLKGGPEGNILQFQYCGVYLCLCTISGMVFGDFKVENMHLFTTMGTGTRSIHGVLEN